MKMSRRAATAVVAVGILFLVSLVTLAFIALDLAVAVSNLLLAALATLLLLFSAWAALKVWVEKRDLALAGQMALGLSAAFFALVLLKP